MTRLPKITCLDDVRALLADLPGPDLNACQKAEEREPTLTKPAGALGRLEEISHWACAWQASYLLRASKVFCNVYAGNHGVCAQGVSAFPAEVTVQMVQNFIHGGAAVNQICGTFGIDLQVHEMNLAEPTRDFSREPAMDDAECAEAIAYGMNSIKDSADLVCLGEMGIGNTTAAAAVAHALYGGAAATWVGRGTGVDDEALGRKIAVVGDAVALHKPTMFDALEVLRCVGGRELAAIAGAVIGARLKRVPVLLDGYICTAAAAPLEAFKAGSLDHCKVAHCSVEPGHLALMEKINQRPLVNLDMRLGEASGATLVVGLVRAAINCHNGMATFSSAGVSDKG